MTYIKVDSDIRSKKLVCNFGINDLDTPIKVNGKHLKVYLVWRAMLDRCYGNSYHNKQVYIKTVVCDEWRYLSNFKRWFDDNYRLDLVEKGITVELDKDILNVDNDIKIYSPNTCLFIPTWLNKVLVVRNNGSSDFIGVIKIEGGKFSSQSTITINGVVHSHNCVSTDLDTAIEKYKMLRRANMEKAYTELSYLNFDEDIINKIKKYDEWRFTYVKVKNTSNK